MAPVTEAHEIENAVNDDAMCSELWMRFSGVNRKCESRICVLEMAFRVMNDCFPVVPVAYYYCIMYIGISSQICSL
jgi:hypothetical protein